MTAEPLSPAELVNLQRPMNIHRCLEAATGAFTSSLLGPLANRHQFNAGLAWLVINLHDACKLMAQLHVRVDVQTPAYPAKAGTVQDLIRECRDALCHATSDRHRMNGGIATGNRMIGRWRERALLDQEFFRECEYDDDIAVYFGYTRLYLMRHAAACLNANVLYYNASISTGWRIEGPITFHKDGGIPTR